MMCTDLYDSGILFAALYELIIGELGIFVPIHVVEDLVDALIAQV